jgi:hypothetical protein
MPITSGAEDSKVCKLHKELDQVAFATRRFQERGFQMPRRSGSLTAFVVQLSSYFTLYSRKAVYTPAEASAWAKYDAHAFSQLQATALCADRTIRNATLKTERANAREWEGYLRTVYNYVFVYTASLRNTTNSATGASD